MLPRCHPSYPSGSGGISQRVRSVYLRWRYPGIC